MGLRELRLKRGMTQQQLAEKLGVTQQHVAAYENGVNSISNMTLAKALRMCDACMWLILANCLTMTISNEAST